MKRLWLAGAACVLLTLHRFPPDRYPVYPPCPFYLLTGLQCPGCGATRALAALLHAHLAEAWHWNQLFVLLLPLAVGYVVIGWWRVLRGEIWPEIRPGVRWALVGVAMVFAVMRNEYQ